MKTHPVPNRSLPSLLLECLRPAALTLTAALVIPSCPAANLDDPTFRSLGGIEPGTLNGVNAMALSVNGQIALAGGFQSYDGVARPGVSLVEADGTLNRAFQPADSPNRPVYCVAFHQIDKVLVGGAFFGIGGWRVPYLARLRPDGSLDTAFTPNYAVPDAGGHISSIVVQPDGRILVAGDCSWTFGQATWQKLARIHADGTFDSSFAQIGNTFAGTIRAVALEPSGKILIAGDVRTGVHTAPLVARLNPDGTVDPNYHPPRNWAADEQNVDGFFVSRLALPSDGKLVLGGAFAGIDGYSRHNLARLNADGSIDTGFNPPETQENILDALTLQRDGKVLISKRRSADGYVVTSFYRLRTNGTIDPGLSMPRLPGGIFSLLVQPDGRILFGGNGALAVTWVDGVMRRGFWRLLPYYLSFPYRTPEGIIRLQLVGEKDRRYVVRASEDGRQWSPWADFVSADDVTTLQDDAGKRHRMYQVGQVLR